MDVNESPLGLRVTLRFLAAARVKSAPRKVERYVKDVKDKNPGYSDAQAWATAWSIYCRYVKPNDGSCHQDKYFKDRA